MKEFVASLNASGVRYLVVGGYAVALHGHPRYTKDIDIWVEAEELNAHRLLEALQSFGFGGLDITAGDFLEPDVIIQLGHPPNRVDLLTSVPGVEFSQCYTSRVVVQLDDLPINFIDLESLRKAKLASGRHQDLADLENLQ